MELFPAAASFGVPDVVTFSILMSACAGMWTIQSSFSCRDYFVVSITFDLVLSETGMLSQAFEVYRLSKGIRNLTLYNNFIKICGKAGDVDSSVLAFRELKDDGLRPDQVRRGISEQH
jgi:pentatricopeptide repeat protein